MCGATIIELFQKGDWVPDGWFEFTSENPNFTGKITARFTAAAATREREDEREVRQLRPTPLGSPLLVFEYPLDDETFEGGTVKFTKSTNFFLFDDPTEIMAPYF